MGGQRDPEEDVWEQSGKPAGKQKYEPEQAYQPHGHAEGFGHTTGDPRNYPTPPGTVEAAPVCHNVSKAHRVPSDALRCTYCSICSYEARPIRGFQIIEGSIPAKRKWNED